MKKIVLITFIIFISCQTNKDLVITTIKADTYIDYGVQYFEIDNYSKYPDSILMNKILSFSENELSLNNQMPPKVLTQHFYRKTLFGGCNKKGLLYEEDLGETQDIRDCKDQHKVAIWIHPSERKINDSTYIKNDSIFNRKIIYWTDKGEYVKDYGLQSDGTRSPDVYRTIYFTRRDSILIKGKTWKILKKGKIERN